MSEPMTIAARCLLAVSPRREIERLSDKELCDLIHEQASREWDNEFQACLSGLALTQAVNRWMIGIRSEPSDPTDPNHTES